MMFVMLVMLIVMMFIFMMLRRQRRHQCQTVVALAQQRGKKTFQLGPYPDHQICLLDATKVRGLESIVMGGGTWLEQQFCRFAAFGNGIGNELQRLDGGKHFNGAGLAAEQQGQKKQGSHGNTLMVVNGICRIENVIILQILK